MHPLPGIRRGSAWAVALALTGLIAAGTATAAPVYLIDLTTDAQPPASDLANVAFSLTYEDIDLNQVFSLDELLAFTGYTDAQANTFSELLGVPDAPGITGTGSDWLFGDGNGSLLRLAADTFTPTTSGPVGDTTGTVPEPASLALALAALAGGLGTRAGRRNAGA